MTVDGDVASWITAGATLALAIGATWALAALRETKRDRHVQVLTDYGQRWDSEVLTAARQKQVECGDDVALAELADKWLHDPKSAPDFYILLRVPNFFEDLAVISKGGRLDMRLVGLGFKALVVDQWTYWERSIEKIRNTSDPWAYSQFRWLNREMRRLLDE